MSTYLECLLKSILFYFVVSHKGLSTEGSLVLKEGLFKLQAVYNYFLNTKLRMDSSLLAKQEKMKDLVHRITAETIWRYEMLDSTIVPMKN